MVLAFIYIFGVIFVLLSFISAYHIWVGAQSMTNLAPNLAVVVFFFMFLFNIGKNIFYTKFILFFLLLLFSTKLILKVRGLYLLILPSEVLEDNQAAKYFLSEAPQFFFFSDYSVIIFLWYCISIVY